MSPVDGDSDKREDAGRHRTRRYEQGELAVETTKRPVAVQQVKEVEHRVEDRSQCVSNSQVHQKVIGNCAHALVTEHDPDHDEIPACGDRHHGDERANKRHLTPQTASAAAATTFLLMRNNLSAPQIRLIHDFSTI